MKRDLVSAAAEALSDLNTFAIIVSILEGGHLLGEDRCYETASRIIRMCSARQGG